MQQHFYDGETKQQGKYNRKDILPFALGINTFAI